MATHGTLLTAKFPSYPFEEMIRRLLRERLEQYAAEMRSNVAQGTEPNSPGWWVGNIQSYVQVENLGGGGGSIMFGVGLIDGTPEQALWQAYIFNFGSKVGGGGTIMSVQGPFYNVNTGAYEMGGAPPVIGHPNWGKGANHWFDKVSDKMVIELPSIMSNIVREAIAAMFSSGAWTLKGHRVTVKI